MSIVTISLLLQGLVISLDITYVTSFILVVPCVMLLQQIKVFFYKFIFIAVSILLNLIYCLIWLIYLFTAVY